MANAAVSAEAKSGGISRREFLYYIWGASIALYAAQFSGLLIWFLLPRFREGEFGGKFILSIDQLPEVNAEPANIPSGRFWLVNLDTRAPNELMKKAPDESEEIVGVAAIYKVCTHLGCIYAWTAANNRFECPCHGSKYRLDGRRIESPAPRTLDRFRMEFLDADKNPIPDTLSELVDDFYAPVPIPDNASFISVDTGDRKMGPSPALICSFTNECP
ncbi:MAG: Rieske 2Fe-2S domain-containing protein [Anaerolineales bacterium]|nr:Rieske 2Fe-2S domain-containing protein [Anaerolineales bacterium]MCB8939378.1 Rieske 2Fe-2S domain-containing protein [Ardenticatenaceae bacterium]